LKSAGLAAQTKADVIPIHMEHEQGELESEEPNTRDVRMEQFKAIIGSILTEALKENNVELHEKTVNKYIITAYSANHNENHNISF